MSKLTPFPPFIIPCSGYLTYLLSPRAPFHSLVICAPNIQPLHPLHSIISSLPTALAHTSRTFLRSAAPSAASVCLTTRSCLRTASSVLATERIRTALCRLTKACKSDHVCRYRTLGAWLPPYVLPRYCRPGWTGQQS